MKEADIEGIKILTIQEHDHVHMVNHNQKSRTGYLNKNETYYKYKYPEHTFSAQKK